MKVTALAGGVGGAKLLVGLDGLDLELTAIVNTADDATFYGVHVSPDVDICAYWLAGLADEERGWGLRNDTFEIVDRLGTLGADNWFRLGDRDLATCIFRTQRLLEGSPLSSVTDEIRRALGVRASIVPMTDDPVHTMITTDDGRSLEFQEYFVKERHEPEVQAVRFDGIATAQPAPGVLDAIRTADVVVLCPSNPVVSIGPILGLPGVREALIQHPRVIAVSPIIRGAALKGPADRLMAAAGITVSASGVAEMYRDFLDAFALDVTEEGEAELIETIGIESIVTDTIMVDRDASKRMAEVLL